mmetsp:Transcript_37432/g.51737  ORF Transcript_37432/g.51737 Transcript_37432/m.51737 type:complete len:104 (+) Transcript_37432:1051-1362(+)
MKEGFCCGEMGAEEVDTREEVDGQQVNGKEGEAEKDEEEDEDEGEKEEVMEGLVDESENSGGSKGSGDNFSSGDEFCDMIGVTTGEQVIIDGDEGGDREQGPK